MKKARIFILATILLSFAGHTFAFIGPAPGQAPGTGGGQFVVDGNFNIGFGTSNATPDTGNFGRVFMVASSTNPGIAVKNTSGSGRTYVWYSQSDGSFALWDTSVSDNRIFIDANGNVGIATSSPEYRIDVNGDIRATGAIIGALSTSVGAENVTGPGSFGTNFGSYSYAFPSALAVGTTTVTGLPTDGLFITGNVGIGTTNPQNKLDVEGAAVIGAAYSGSVTAPANGLLVQGDVGIGTTTPQYTLDVNGDIRATGEIIGVVAASVAAENVTGPGSFGTNFGVYSYAFPSALAVGTTTITGLPTDGLLVRGNVLIGTSANPAQVAINGSVDTGGGDLAVYDEVAGGGAIRVFDSAGTLNYQFGDGALNVLNGAYFRTYNGDTSGTKTFEVFSDTGNVYTAGSVGIGTTTPQYTLDVNGTFRVSGAATLGGNFSFGGAALTNLNMNGNNINGVNKLTVTTIDPEYEIGGKKYATYVSSIAGGVKEEYVSQAKLAPVSNLEFRNSNFEFSEPTYEYVIDFNNLEKGSDLWLWRQVVDFSRDNVEVLATPYGVPASMYYVIEDNKIIFRGIVNLKSEILDSIPFSFRLVGKRRDWRDWPTVQE